MIGQTIVNVRWGKVEAAFQPLRRALGLLILVTALSDVIGLKSRMAVLAGIMAIVAVKTFSWHSLQPATVKTALIAETVVMLVTVAATVSTGNLVIGVLGGIIVMALLPARIKRRLKAEKSSPAQEK